MSDTKILKLNGQDVVVRKLLDSSFLEEIISDNVINMFKETFKKDFDVSKLGIAKNEVLSGKNKDFNALVFLTNKTDVLFELIAKSLFSEDIDKAIVNHELKKLNKINIDSEFLEFISKWLKINGNAFVNKALLNLE